MFTLLECGDKRDDFSPGYGSLDEELKYSDSRLTISSGTKSLLGVGSLNVTMSIVI